MTFHQCHCTARYTGKNCEIDTGPPCRSNPCYNAGLCTEDIRGEYHCDCSQTGYTGNHCEIEISIHPLCEKKPCLNEGICRISMGIPRMECVCANGYTGPTCEVVLFIFR